MAVTALRPQNNFVILAFAPKETAYGTAVADASIIKQLPLEAPALAEPTRNRIYDEAQIKGHEFAMDTAQQTTLFQDFNLPVSFPASSEITAFLFAQALGALTTSGLGPYTHTITAQNGTISDQLPSTSIVNGTRGQVGTYKKYKGCIPNEVKLAVDSRGRAKLNATYFTDGTEADASAFALPATVASTTPLWGKNATFKSVNAGGALVDYSTQLRSFDITWNNNLSREDNHSLITAGLSLTSLRFATRTMTVTVKLWGDKNEPFYADLTGDTLKYIELKIVNGADSVTFAFNRCVVSNVKDSFDSIRNVIELTYIPFVVTSTGISPVTITVVNTISAYLT